ncbi:MAG: hypothetical protein OEW44_04740 [Gemmatimonadota bacterium]|jgi:hypothetical protein|nr:hypothetical protein [Gemmatimonadota bacterium]
MAASFVPLEDVIRFWHSKGVAPCAEAQADGVPCPSLGRQCETCAQALEALANAVRGSATPRPESRP